MQLLSFYMPKTYRQKQKDVLLAYNQLNPNSPVSEIELLHEKQITQYLTTFISLYRNWEDKKELPNPQGAKPLKIDFALAKKEITIQKKCQDGPLNEEEKDKYTISLTSKEIEWLTTAIQFFTGLAPLLREALHNQTVIAEEQMSSIEEVVEAVITEKSTQTLIQADIAELGHKDKSG
jgi:hypothetical protein